MTSIILSGLRCLMVVDVDRNMSEMVATWSRFYNYQYRLIIAFTATMLCPALCKGGYVGRLAADSLWLEIKDLDERNKDVFELQQMVRLANLMIEATFQRTESRGVQFRSDFNKPNNSWSKAQTFVKN